MHIMHCNLALPFERDWLPRQSLYLYSGSTHCSFLQLLDIRKTGVGVVEDADDETMLLLLPAAELIYGPLALCQSIENAQKLK